MDQREMDTEQKALTILVAEENGDLKARFDPTVGLAPPDLVALHERLMLDGCSECLLDQQAIDEFLALCATTAKVLERKIGQRRDGSFVLEVERDLMSAYLTLVPPQGGKPAGPAVIDALREKGVVFGIHHAVLDEALAAGQCKNLLIAEGILDEDGTRCASSACLSKGCRRSVPRTRMPPSRWPILAACRWCIRAIF